MAVLPHIQAFVVCREMYESPQSHDFVLVAPLSHLVLPRFPAAGIVSIYAHLTDARGSCQIGLRLVDNDGETVWTAPGGPLLQDLEPLKPHRVVLYDVPIDVPRPGRYDLVLLGNGEPLAMHAIWALLREPG